MYRSPWFNRISRDGLRGMGAFPGNRQWYIPPTRICKYYFHRCESLVRLRWLCSSFSCFVHSDIFLWCVALFVWFAAFVKESYRCSVLMPIALTIFKMNIQNEYLKKFNHFVYRQGPKGSNHIEMLHITKTAQLSWYVQKLYKLTHFKNTPIECVIRLIFR